VAINPPIRSRRSRRQLRDAERGEGGKIYDPRLSKTDVDEWRELAVASYLIAVRERLWMSFLPFGDPPWGRPDARVAWQADWRYWTEPSELIYSANLGRSLDAADAAASSDGTATAAAHYKRSGVYQRAYENGLAIVNPTDRGAAIRLDRAYRYARNGRPTGSNTITVPARRAAVLIA
jgi:hypothetical protein